VDIFSNREIAIVIWAVICSTYIFTSTKMIGARKSVKNIISSFFVWPIMKSVSLMLVYLGCMIYVLFDFGLWDFHQTKNTLIWFFSVAFMSLFSMESIKKDRRFFKHAVLDNLKLLAIIAFIIGVYPFSIIVELVLVPVFVIIGIMLAIAESDTKYLQVQKVLNNIIAMIGLTIVAYAMYMLATEFSGIAQEKFIYDFITPPLLTLLFIPFIFFMMVYSSYETVFARLKFFIKKPRLRLVAKIHAIFIFNFRIELLEKWVSSLAFVDRDSYEEIRDSYRQIFIAKELEESSKDINKNEGWSPCVAKNFLLSEGLETGDYHRSFDGWSAHSPMIEIGEGSIPDNLTYYSDGNGSSVKSLKIKLNVNDKRGAKQAHISLLHAAQLLYQSATKLDLPDQIKESIVNGMPTKARTENCSVALKKEAWPNHEFGGYDLKFIMVI
jgi:hypothetical protein